MGNYFTSTSISVNFPNILKGNTTTTDSFGTSFFMQKVDDSESMVNGAVAMHYSLPVSPTPPLLITLTKQLAMGAAIRDGFSVEGQQRNQYLDDYKSALDILALLRKGEMKLTYTDGSLVTVNTSGRFKSSTLNYTPIFGRDEQTKWDRDQDEIDDQENARE